MKEDGETDRIIEKEGERNKAEDVWGEAQVDTLAELRAAFLRTERQSQIREGWLLRSPHAGLH